MITKQFVLKANMLVFLALGIQALSFAQMETLTDRRIGDPEVESPPRNFATAEEHYNFLLDEADGGTQHTMATIPVWDGLWSAGYNSMPSLFLDGGSMAVAMSPGGAVKEGVLTPAYEAQFRARQ